MTRPCRRSCGSPSPVPVVHRPFPAVATPAPLATHPSSPRRHLVGLAAPSLLWAFPSPAPVGNNGCSPTDPDLDQAFATPTPPPGGPAHDPRDISCVPEIPLSRSSPRLARLLLATRSPSMLSRLGRRGALTSTAGLTASAATALAPWVRIHRGRQPRGSRRWTAGSPSHPVVRAGQLFLLLH